jgi:hypothetical protein
VVHSESEHDRDQGQRDERQAGPEKLRLGLHLDYALDRKGRRHAAELNQGGPGLFRSDDDTTSWATST